MYVFVFRKGVDDPEPSNPQNNNPWWCARKYHGIIPEARMAKFDIAYTVKNIEGRQTIGPESLVQAVRNFYHQDHPTEQRRAFMTIVNHILEAARFRVIEEHIRNNMADDPWSDRELQITHKAMIKGWKLIYDVLMKSGFDPDKQDDKMRDYVDNVQ